MNKKILLSGLAAMVAATTLSAKTGDVLSQEKLMELKRGSKVLQNPTLKLKKGMDMDSVYFIKIDAQGPRGIRPLTAFLDKKTGAVYFGGGFDKNGEQMKFPVDVQTVKDGVAFTIGNGSKEIYVVTDPECPFCQKFERAAAGKLDDYKINFIFMPLSFHKEAPAMTQWILSAKTPEEMKKRMEEVMIKRTSEYKNDPSYKEYKKNMDEANKLVGEYRKAQQAKDSKKMQEIQNKLASFPRTYPYTKEVQEKITKGLKAAEELGARGTPAVFDKDFKSIAWPTLVQGGGAVKAKVKKVEPVKADTAKKVDTAKKEDAKKK